MNRTQKGACYGLLLTLLFLAVPVLDKYESSLGLLATHLIGYCVLLPALIVPLFLLTKKSVKKQVEFDERDKAIIVRGIISAFIVVSVVELIGYVVAFLSNEETGIVISVSRLPVIVYAGFIIFIFTLSVAVLVQYKWRPDNG